MWEGALGEKRKKGAAGQRFVSPIPRSDHPAAGGMGCKADAAGRTKIGECQKLVPLRDFAMFHQQLTGDSHSRQKSAHRKASEGSPGLGTDVRIVVATDFSYRVGECSENLRQGP